MARPTKCTDSLINEIVEKLEKGLPQEVAAELCGISASTLYRWKDEGAKGIEPYAEFLEAVTRAIAAGTETLHDTVRAGDAPGVGFGPAKACAFLLERTRPKHYARQVNVKVEEAIDRVLEVVRGVCSPEDFTRVLEGLERLDSEAGETAPSGTESTEPGAVH